MDRICLNCKDTFVSSQDGYELCSECGGATVPLELKLKLERTPKTDEKTQSFLEGRLNNFFACQNGYVCYLEGSYTPSCEVPSLRTDCLTALHNRLDTLELKVDRLLKLLDRKEQ